MFDVSFSELLIIGVVALLVIGPEKLPKVARTVGAFTGRMQRYVGQIKEEVNREMRFEELQKLQQEIQTQASQLKNAVQTQVNGVKATIETSLPENELAQESLATFELTSPTQPPRKLTQFGQRPPKPVDTPLFADLSEGAPITEPSVVKASAAKIPVKKTAKKPVAKKSLSKKSTAQAQ